MKTKMCTQRTMAESDSLSNVKCVHVLGYKHPGDVEHNKRRLREMSIAMFLIPTHSMERSEVSSAFIAAGIVVCI